MGKFAVAVNDEGALAGAGFGGKEALPRHADLARDVEKTAKARQQIQEYLDGKRQTFTLKLAPTGTSFQQTVWSLLTEIPFGKTRSYKDIAVDTGNVRGARAVGGAVGSNPICLVIPCHRVIATGGGLGGFAFGLKVKKQLLELEGILLPMGQ